MDAICRNCHFFAKERFDRNGTKVFLPLDRDERDDVRLNQERPVSDDFSLVCHQGVWDEEQLPVRMNLEFMDVELNKTPREGQCFFFPYNPGMLIKAAEEMQKRQEENRQLKKSYEHTRIALYIAAGALAVNAIPLVVNVIIAYFKP